MTSCPAYPSMPKEVSSKIQNVLLKNGHTNHPLGTETTSWPSLTNSSSHKHTSASTQLKKIHPVRTSAVHLQRHASRCNVATVPVAVAGTFGASYTPSCLHFTTASRSRPCRMTSSYWAAAPWKSWMAAVSRRRRAASSQSNRR